MEMEVETRPVSISDIASALNMAKATVSYALSGKGRVAPSTREKILQTAHEMGFQPNPHAQRLSTGRCSNTIALCFQLDLGVNARKLQVIQGKLIKLGYEIPAHALSYEITPDNELQITEIVNMVCRQRPLAIISTKLPPPALEELKRYQANGGIVVCYDTPMDIDCDKVLFNRENSSYLATKHLLELGHRDIGYCAPGEATPGGVYLQGYCRALQEYGIQATREWLFGTEPYDFVGGLYEEAGALLAQNFLALKQRPTAMCITDDYAVTAFAAALEDAGLRVPDDVSIVGCDDSPIARYGKLKITTVTHPVRVIAEHAVHFVTSRIEDSYQGPTRQIVLEGELIVRESATRFG